MLPGILIHHFENAIPFANAIVFQEYEGRRLPQTKRPAYCGLHLFAGDGDGLPCLTVFVVGAKKGKIDAHLREVGGKLRPHDRYKSYAVVLDLPSLQVGGNLANKLGFKPQAAYRIQLRLPDLAWYPSELTGNLDNPVGLDHVTFLDIVETLDRDTTFVALGHVGDIFLETFEG